MERSTFLLDETQIPTQWYNIAPDLPEPGETAGRRRMSAWLRDGVTAYADRHDDLPGDATSRLSAYLHFGCLSPT